MTELTSGDIDEAESLATWLLVCGGLTAATATYAWTVEGLFGTPLYVLFASVALLMLLAGVWIRVTIPAIAPNGGD